MKNMQSVFINLSISMIFLSLACEGQKAGPDEAEIRALRQQFNTAIAQHDSTRIERFCTADYTAISSRNVEIKGIENERQALANEFKTKKEVVYVRTPGQIKVFPTWNMASETGHYTGQWQESDGLVQMSGTYYAKWHKIQGSWRIRVEVFTPLTCTGSKFCDQAPVLE